MKEYIFIQAGREILLKSIVQAIPTYAMSMFLLPWKICKEIMSLMSKFGGIWPKKLGSIGGNGKC